MDLYSDLPPTKDGSAATVGKEQIHLLKQPALPPTAPPSVATQPSTSPRAPQTCAESSNEPGKTPPLSDKDKPLFMKPRQLNKTLLPSALQPRPKVNSKPKPKPKPALPVAPGVDDLRSKVGDGKGKSTAQDAPEQRSRGAITWNVEDVDDEYDPSEPNNYELYLETRLRKDHEKASKRSIDRQVKEQEEKRKKLAEERKRQAVMMSAPGPSSKGAGRGRGRGRNLLVPAWLKAGQEKGSGKDVVGLPPLY